MSKHRDSLDSKILNRIRRHGRGWVFTPGSFSDLGNQPAIRLALLRHTKDATLLRLKPGLYYYPKVHKDIGPLSPSPDEIAKAMAGRAAVRLQPSGAYAANLLGLSEQVPMRVTYLTDGPSKSLRIGNQQIILRKTTPKNMAASGRTSGLLIQALRYLGQPRVDASVVAKLREHLPTKERKQMLKDIRYAPAWIGSVIRQLASD